MRRVSTPDLSGDVLVRYRQNYGLPREAPEPTMEQVKFHLELERSLTAERTPPSTPENRWETFQRCYDLLYTSLPWLSSTGSNPDVTTWTRMIGRPPQRVYEIGSGAGRLAAGLASNGFEVTATDISRERGGNRATGKNLQWGLTDGVNLARFADPDSFDVVISDQVIEHLHPDDLLTHLEGVRTLLRSRGRYISGPRTLTLGPQTLVGSSDGISRWACTFASTPTANSTRSLDKRDLCRYVVR